MEVNDTQIAAIETALRDEVRKLAADAARAHLGDKAGVGTYRAVLTGLESGNPTTFDSLPWLHWGVDGLPSWGDLFYETTADIVGDYPGDNAIMAALQDYYGQVIGRGYADQTLFETVEHICRHHLGEE